MAGDDPGQKKHKQMERIRETNINTAETFNEVFESKIDWFDSYNNIIYWGLPRKLVVN